MLASVVANCHRDSKKTRKPYAPKDFLPPGLLDGGKPPQKPDPSTLALATAKAFGAPPEILAQIREAQARQVTKKPAKRKN